MECGASSSLLTSLEQPIAQTIALAAACVNRVTAEPPGPLRLEAAAILEATIGADGGLAAFEVGHRREADGAGHLPIGVLGLSLWLCARLTRSRRIAHACAFAGC